MKTLNIVRRYGAKATLAAALAVPALSFAAVPAEVTAAIGDFKADGLTIAAAVLVGVIAIWALKKLRSAL